MKRIGTSHQPMPGKTNKNNRIHQMKTALNTQYVEQKSNEHQKNMRNTITALKYVP